MSISTHSTLFIINHIYLYYKESMATAIEESECILVCMSELYKESPNCRMEAEYIIQLKKPFVPLIMQKGYRPGEYNNK